MVQRLYPTYRVDRLFECTPDRATAQTRLQRWSEPVKAAGLTCFDTFLNTFAHWQEGILNYFLL
ncbi:MAG: transposase [Candidatus Competibacteraceae bacterium]|nr:transposase [Candidatus Competibacteraceae bacterium]